MNKLLSIICVCGVWAATSMSCMDDTVVDADMSQIDDWGISHFDGTIYEYLEQGDKSLGLHSTLCAICWIMMIRIPQGL